MTGLLPAVAHWSPATSPQPAEVCFRQGCWMIEAGTVIRGYRQTAWQFETAGPVDSYADDPRQRLDVLGRGNVIGSQVTINLAANEHLLRRFVEPADFVPAAVRRRR